MKRDDVKLMVVLGICGLASSLAARTPDPIVPLLSDHFGSPVTTIALLSTVYALPYGLCQPVLGPLGDLFGKTLVLRICMVLFTAALAVGAVATSLPILFLSRVVAGAAAGGVIPLALALIGDRFEAVQRQIALSRIVASAVIGQLVGVLLSGVLGEALSWRAPLALCAAVAALATALSLARLRDPDTGPRPRLSRASLLGGYRDVFANPIAYVCYGAVFLEGIAVYGVMPFVAEILRQRGTGGASEAGFVIAGLGVGGILFSLAAPRLLAAFRPLPLMRAGGLLSAAGLAAFSLDLPWPAGTAAFLAVGLGFFTLHNGLQTRAVALAPRARGSAVALHAFFFFIGQGLAPVIIGPLLHRAGEVAALVTSAALMAAAGLLSAGLIARLDARRSP